MDFFVIYFNTKAPIGVLLYWHMNSVGFILV